MRIFVILAVVLALATLSHAQSCSSRASDMCTCVATTGCGICVGAGGGSTLGCVDGTAAGPGPNGTGTCSGTWYHAGNSDGSAIDSACPSTNVCGNNAPNSCGCFDNPQCGICRVSGGAAPCVGGNSAGPYNNALQCAGTWANGPQTECKVAAAKAIGGIIAAVCVPIFFICLIIVWWCLRGRHWWASTNHKRCLCSEEACCNGFLCLHPYDAQPPPHGKGDGVKAQAVRVAPCFPHSPIAACANLDGFKKMTPEEIEAYHELHPCGLGCGCACAWIPGCLCWKPPKKCLQCCEDTLPGPGVPIGGGKVDKKAAKAAAKEEKKKNGGGGGLFGKKKKKNTDSNQAAV